MEVWVIDCMAVVWVPVEVRMAGIPLRSDERRGNQLLQVLEEPVIPTHHAPRTNHHLSCNAHHHTSNWKCLSLAHTPYSRDNEEQ